jgi:hypothetical protein
MTTYREVCERAVKEYFRRQNEITFIQGKMAAYQDMPNFPRCVPNGIIRDLGEAMIAAGAALRRAADAMDQGDAQ